MTIEVSDWYPGDTKVIQITVTLNGVVQDIRPDTVTLRIKTSPDDTDIQSVLTSTADVTTSGINGIAIFTLLPALSSGIAPREYSYDIVWIRPSGYKRVLLSGKVKLLDRVSDP